MCDAPFPPRLYADLSEGWPLLSDPADYAGPAASYRSAITSNCLGQPRTLLGLGSGGGNNASHLKAHFALTLVDVSPGMLAVSRALNPECEPIESDMRQIRLGRLFDAVFIHDAGARGLRYLQWTWNPDPGDTTFLADFAFLLREADGSVRLEYDRHVVGLFPRSLWLRLVAEVGFAPKVVPFEHPDLEPGTGELFVGTRPPAAGHHECDAHAACSISSSGPSGGPSSWRGAARTQRRPARRLRHAAER
jgi:SAM-dependent methyltransferase